MPDHPIGGGGEEQDRLLELRSGYGPYTSRLASRAVDEAVDAAGPLGLGLRYAMPRDGVPELVRTFSTWLREAHGIDGGGELRIALYAHAANGGIRIDETGATDVPGLFACGEVTGGMHGADRIGGLASANALVFGRRAGVSAARHALGRAASPVTFEALSGGVDAGVANDVLGHVRAAFAEHAMVGRTATGLAAAKDAVREASATLDEAARDHGSQADDAACARAVTLRRQLALARCMLGAMDARKESRGSHGRADYPVEDPSLAYPSIIRQAR